MSQCHCDTVSSSPFHPPPTLSGHLLQDDSVALKERKAIKKTDPETPAILHNQFEMEKKMLLECDDDNFFSGVAVASSASSSAAPAGSRRPKAKAKMLALPGLPTGWK